MSKINVLLVGETWIVTKFHTKGFDVVPLGGYDDYSVYFKKGMEPFEDIAISHIPNHLVMSAYPQTMEQISKFDVVIISDCGRNTLTMYPDMFTVPMGPDKVQLTADYVKNGGSLIMVGGYVDFQGFQGKGNYHGSAIEEVLPVNIMDRDDRVEGTKGVTPKVIDQNHDILKGVSTQWPAFLGHQKVFPKEDASVLATIGDNDDAFIVVGESGKGRSMAFTSDLAPHWGTDFVNWSDYGKFWHNSIQWLAKK
jgi:uncharacterized membrane protein